MSDDTTTRTPEDRRQYWRGFTVDTSDDAARAAFLARFGELPARIIRQRSVVLVGPIPTTPEDGGAGGLRKLAFA